MATTIGSGKTFYVRVRHKATTGLKSEWSEPVKFMTTNLQVTTPSFKTSRAVVSSSSYMAEISAFEGTGGQTFASLDYQVSTKDSFTSLTQNVVADTALKTSIHITGIGASKTLYARFRYRSNANVVSEWSDTFTVKGESYKVSNLSWVDTNQKTLASFWKFAISGGTPNWNLNFISTVWELSESSNFTSPIRHTVTNGSLGPTGQNFLVNLETKGFKPEVPYYVRVRKIYALPTGDAIGSDWLTTSAKIPTATLSKPIISPVGNNVDYSVNPNKYFSHLTTSLPVVQNAETSVSSAFSLKSVEWEYSRNGNVLGIIKDPLAAEPLKLPLSWQWFETPLGQTYNFSVRVRVTLKSGPLSINPNGMEVTSDWSDPRTFKTTLVNN